LISQDAIVASAASPAINVCVPQRSEGRINRRALTSRRPSMLAGRIGFDGGFIDKDNNRDNAIKTSRSGRADTAGMRYRNRSSRYIFTLAWRRSMAADVFFVREAKLAREAPDGIGGRLNAGCVMRGGGAFGHRNVAISFDDFDGKPPMGASLPFPLGRPCGAAQALPVRRIARPHRAPGAGESCSATPPHAHLTVLRSIPESASGIGADRILPPKQDEPRIDTKRKPPDPGFGPGALRSISHG